MIDERVKVREVIPEKLWIGNAMDALAVQTAGRDHHVQVRMDQ